jgi:hypothetical protein
MLPACVPGEACLKNRVCATLGASVQTDWYGWLPDAKLQAFREYAGEFEARYAMLSVSLNEAITHRDRGALTKSFQLVDVAPALCRRFTDHLQGLLRSLEEHAKHYGVVPSVAPLDAENFQGSRAHRSALMSSLLSRVLLSQRAQFLSKIATLREMVTDLGNDFCQAAEDLAATRATAESTPLWSAMDSGHYDLNTCLRESMILLKCFLRALPDDQLLRFQKTVANQMTPPKPETPRRVIRHRRMAPIAGQ